MREVVFWGLLAALMASCGLDAWADDDEAKRLAHWERQDRDDARRRLDTVRSAIRAADLAKDRAEFGSRLWYAHQDEISKLRREVTVLGRTPRYRSLDDRYRRERELAGARREVLRAQAARVERLKEQHEFGSSEWYAARDAASALRRDTGTWAYARPPKSHAELERERERVLRTRRATLQAQIAYAEKAKARAEFGSRTWYAWRDRIQALQRELGAIR